MCSTAADNRASHLLLLQVSCGWERQLVTSLVLLSAAVPQSRGQARPGILPAPDTLIPLPPPVSPFQVSKYSPGCLHGITCWGAQLMQPLRPHTSAV